MLKLLEFRKSRGWTQEQLSERSGVSRSYISELERNGHNAAIDIVCKICKALGTTPNDLIEEKYWK